MTWEDAERWLARGHAQEVSRTATTLVIRTRVLVDDRGMVSGGATITVHRNASESAGVDRA